MINHQFEPKSELFNRFRFIFMQKESGILTLLTDAKKSVLMRFSDGQLTSTRCRSWDIQNTLSALLEAGSVKFSYIRSSGENKPPLMAPDEFMMLVDPEGSGLFADDEKAVVQEHEAVVEEVGSVTRAKAKVEPERESATHEAAFTIDKITAARMNYF